MDLINEKNIFIDVDLKSKSEALEYIATQAGTLEITTSVPAYYNALIAREEEVTTGFGFGIAIPHAKINEIKKAAIIIVKLKNPVDWNSLDGAPVKFIIALAVPESQKGTTHLKLLSTIARKLMHEDFRKDLTETKDKDKIKNLLSITID